MQLQKPRNSGQHGRAPHLARESLSAPAASTQCAKSPFAERHVPPVQGAVNGPKMAPPACRRGGRRAFSHAVDDRQASDSHAMHACSRLSQHELGTVLSLHLGTQLLHRPETAADAYPANTSRRASHYPRHEIVHVGEILGCVRGVEGAQRSA